MPGRTNGRPLALYIRSDPQLVQDNVSNYAASVMAPRFRMASQSRQRESQYTGRLQIAAPLFEHASNSAVLALGPFLESVEFSRAKRPDLALALPPSRESLAFLDFPKAVPQ